LSQCLDKIPGGAANEAKEPINIADGKVVLPSKFKVLTSMEELIHQFILVTEGVNAPPGEVYFSAENPKGELGFYINSKGGGTPNRLKIRAPSFVNLSILPQLLPGHMVSDTVAIGCAETLLSQGLRIPEDCSVLGFDDVLPAAVATPGITTIHQPLKEMGLQAAEWMLEALEKGGAQAPRLRMWPPELVVRMSSSSPRSASEPTTLKKALCV